MVEKKDAGPKKRKRRKAKAKPRVGQVISQKVVVNVGKDVPKRKRRTGTQAKRSVQPQQVAYQQQGIPLQPNYSTEINDLRNEVKTNNLSIQNHPFNQTGNLELLKQLEAQRVSQLEAQSEPVSNEELEEASRLARGRSLTRKRSASIKADPSPDPSPTGFQLQNDFVSGAEEPAQIQTPGPTITLLPETQAQKKVESVKKGKGRPVGSTKAKKQAESPGQQRMEEFTLKKLTPAQKKRRDEIKAADEARKAQEAALKEKPDPLDRDDEFASAEDPSFV